MVYYPKNNVEQQLIADCFRNLDNLITLHQRKCISFTGRAGRLISTVNKKRITSSWEQRKLGDIGKARSGVGFPDADQGGVTGVPFFKVSDMNLDGNENEMIVATLVNVPRHKDPVGIALNKFRVVLHLIFQAVKLGIHVRGHPGIEGYPQGQVVERPPKPHLISDFPYIHLFLPPLGSTQDTRRSPESLLWNIPNQPPCRGQLR